MLRPAVGCGVRAVGGGTDLVWMCVSIRLWSTDEGDHEGRVRDGWRGALSVVLCVASVESLSVSLLEPLELAPTPHCCCCCCWSHLWLSCARDDREISTPATVSRSSRLPRRVCRRRCSSSRRTKRRASLEGQRWLDAAGDGGSSCRSRLRERSSHRRASRGWKEEILPASGSAVVAGKR